MESFSGSNENATSIPLDIGGGIVNPTYDFGDDQTAYEVASSCFQTPISPAQESDMYANHSNQYVNQHSITDTSTNNDQQAPNHTNTGRQFEQNSNVSEIDMGYRSCHAIAMARRQNSIPSSEYEREGYAQAVDVFNPVSNRQSNDFKGSFRRVQSGTNRKESRLQQRAGIETINLQLEENEYVGPTEASGRDDLDDTILKTEIPYTNPYTGTPKAKRREYQGIVSGAAVDCDPEEDTLSASLSDPIPFRNRLSTSIEEHYEDIDQYKNVPKATSSRNDTSQRTAAKEKNIKIQIVPRATLQRSQRPSLEQKYTYPKMQATADSASENPKTPQSSVPSEAPNPNTYVSMEAPLVESDKKRQRSGRYCCILCSVLLALFVLVTVSLAVSVSLILIQDKEVLVERSELSANKVNTSGHMYQDFPKTLDDRDLLFELQSQLHDLKAKNAALEKTVERQDNETNDRLDQMMARQTHFSFQMDSLSSEYHNKVANLSAILQTKSLDTLPSCSLKSATDTRLKPSGIHMETSFKPDKNEIKDNFVLFAFCTFMGMEDVSLDEQERRDLKQYRCRCKSSKKSLTYKACTLYYWLCPRK